MLGPNSYVQRAHHPRLRPLPGKQIEQLDCLSLFLSYTNSRAKGEDGVLAEPNTASPETAIDVFALIFVAYVLLLVLVRLFERHMIFFPDYPDRLEGAWQPSMLGPEEIWVTATDGTRLHAWWIPNANAKFTFLAFHGNA